MAAAACAEDPEAAGQEAGLAASLDFGSCGLGDHVLAATTLGTASIPGLSALQRAQIVAAVQESAHTDVTTVEEALSRVDDHEVNDIVLRDDGTNQFYTEIEFGAGGNSYGAIFYWGTAVKGAAIHDGFQEECGPLTFNYDQGDTAPECAGFLDYTNTASFAALDAYLPSNVAQAIVDARAFTPFSSVASVIAVNGVGELRLGQLFDAARAAGLVGAGCSGIHDQLALSAGEAAAIVELVDQASAEELHGILRFFIDHTVVANLLGQRPFATVAAISGIDGVGPATLRTFRNAAARFLPFEELVAAVDAINHPDHQIRIDSHFEWLPLVTSPSDRLAGATCFGIDPALLPPGATDRPQLADAAEVVDNFTDAVSASNFFGELPVSPSPGIADLEYRAAGRAFFGCYFDIQPNPFVFDRQTFFVDAATGLSLLITSHDVE